MEGQSFVWAVTRQIIRQARPCASLHIDLKYSGDFYKSIEVKKRSESKFELVSGDTLWTGKLRPIFGKEVLGLNKEATLQVETEAEKDLTAFLIKELK